MSTDSIDDSVVSTQTPSSERIRGVWRGVLTGLPPLGLLIILVSITLLLTVFSRLLLVGSDFFAQQQAAVVVLIAGLILAIAVYAVACWRVLRRVAGWQQEGVKIQSKATLWTLAATALVVLLPLLLAILLPQHPLP
jgi:hypothetical protein